jgi:hypothetical protein
MKYSITFALLALSSTAVPVMKKNRSMLSAISERTEESSLTREDSSNSISSMMVQPDNEAGAVRNDRIERLGIHDEFGRFSDTVADEVKRSNSVSSIAETVVAGNQGALKAGRSDSLSSVVSTASTVTAGNRGRDLEGIVEETNVSLHPLVRQNAGIWENAAPNTDIIPGEWSLGTPVEEISDRQRWERNNIAIGVLKPNEEVDFVPSDEESNKVYEELNKEFNELAFGQLGTSKLGRDAERYMRKDYTPRGGPGRGGLTRDAHTRKIGVERLGVERLGRERLPDRDGETESLNAPARRLLNTKRLG